MRILARVILLLVIATCPLWAGTITVGSSQTVSAVESNAFINQTLFTFTDSVADPVSNFSATITWGDGSNFSIATISEDASGLYSVLGSHEYTEEGPYTYTVTLLQASALPTTMNGTAIVADGQLSGTGSGQLSFTAGLVSFPVVGGFTDQDPSGMASDYFASINWGDGSTSSGTIVANPLGGFSVEGTHTYSVDDSFTISTTVNDLGGSTTTFVDQAIVGSTTTPEPSSLLLLGTGALGLFGPIRRKLLPRK